MPGVLRSAKACWMWGEWGQRSRGIQLVHVSAHAHVHGSNRSRDWINRAIWKVVWGNKARCRIAWKLSTAGVPAGLNARLRTSAKLVSKSQPTFFMIPAASLLTLWLLCSVALPLANVGLLFNASDASPPTVDVETSGDIFPFSTEDNPSCGEEPVGSDIAGQRDAHLQACRECECDEQALKKTDIFCMYDTHAQVMQLRRFP